MLKKEINEKIKTIYEQNVKMGWWDEPRKFETVLMLIISEIAEAMEGDRKNLMDDHLPHVTMVEAELADTLIRLLDLMGYIGLEYELGEFSKVIEEPEVMEEFSKFTTSVKLFRLTKIVSMLIESDDECDEEGYFKYPEKGDEESQNALSIVVFTVLLLAKSLQFENFLKTVNEKVAYNLTRADHQKENRAKDNGKKY